MSKAIDMKRSWTESRVFAPFTDQDGDPTELMIGTHIGTGVLQLFGGIMWLTLDPYSWYIIIPILLAFVALTHGAPYLGRLTPLRAIDNRRLNRHGEEYNAYNRRYDENYAKGSRTLLYRILDLPKEDQRLFPRDIVTILSRDLLPTARYEINASLEKTLDDIAERNRERKIMEQKAISHEGVLAAIESARENIQIETKTLKEFS